MTRKLTYIIEKEFHNKTVGYFLKEQEFCHQTIVYLKQTEEGICRNGQWVYVNTLLEEGDTLTLQWKEPVWDTTIIPVDLPIEIIYEDDDYLILNKSANMPIHPSMGNHDNTLANAILSYYQKCGVAYPYRCINRLDKDTTGLTIIAKNCQAAGILSRSVASRNIHRTYLAIVEGEVTEGMTINAPIARKEASTIERCVDEEHGEEAITHVFPLSYNKELNLSLIRLQLETGRTHQIRVHMKHIGHPLIGDFLYNPNMQYIKRQALHAYQLSFIHPITKKEVHYTAPLPDDMNQLFNGLKIV